MYVVRCSWTGLNALIQLPFEEPRDASLDPTTELAEMSADSIRMIGGFCLTDPRDPRFIDAMKHREQFGRFLHNASVSLRSQGAESGDDHIDAVLAVIRASEVFLLDFAFTRNSFSTSKKSYENSRDVSLMNSKQKHFSRAVWVKRAQVRPRVIPGLCLC